MTTDLSRLAALARQIIQNPKSTTPAYIGVLEGWAADALKAVRPQPHNVDWKTLADFVAASPVTSQSPHPTARTSRLAFTRTDRMWRKEMVAPFKGGGYWIVEQPGDHWSVNYMDKAGNLYAVNGIAIADTYEEGLQACELDTINR